MQTAVEDVDSEFGELMATETGPQDEDEESDPLNLITDGAMDEGDPVATEQAAAPDPLADLESLLSESLADRAETSAIKAARERLKRGGQSAKERLEDAMRVEKWQLAHEWEAVANVVYFSKQVCACGQSSSVFLGLMERQRHRHLKMSQRWYGVKESKAALPNEVIIRTIQVPLCECCATPKGWDFSKATEWKEGTV